MCVCVCIDVVDTLTVDPALLLIVVGSVMFLITFLGCFGALRNTICLLKMVCQCAGFYLVLTLAVCSNQLLFSCSLWDSWWPFYSCRSQLHSWDTFSLIR